MHITIPCSTILEHAYLPQCRDKNKKRGFTCNKHTFNTQQYKHINLGWELKYVLKIYLNINIICIDVYQHDNILIIKIYLGNCLKMCALGKQPHIAHCIHTNIHTYLVDNIDSKIIYKRWKY